MISKTLPSMVAVMLCFELIIIRYFFNVCKKLTMYTVMYDIQLHFQKFMRGNNSWMAGALGPQAVVWMPLSYTIHLKCPAIHGIRNSGSIPYIPGKFMYPLLASSDNQ